MKEIPGKSGRCVGQYGNIWLLSHLNMKKGDVIPVGEHAFDHVSWLGKGSVLFEYEGHEPVRIHAENFIGVRAGNRHKITALEDGTNWTCFHVVLDTNGQPEPSLDHYQHLLEHP
jgi:quercetin dioxygenase-like cupin family protein